MNQKYEIYFLIFFTYIFFAAGRLLEEAFIQDHLATFGALLSLMGCCPFISFIRLDLHPWNAFNLDSLHASDAWPFLPLAVHAFRP